MTNLVLSQLSHDFNCGLTINQLASNLKLSTSQRWELIETLKLLCHQGKIANIKNGQYVLWGAKR